MPYYTINTHKKNQDRVADEIEDLGKIVCLWDGRIEFQCQVEQEEELIARLDGLEIPYEV